jgi:hypothetical protein
LIGRVSQSIPLLIALFAISTFSYAAWSTLADVPSDLYPLSGRHSERHERHRRRPRTILSTYLIGWAADHYSFQPVLVAASAVPLAATLIVCLLVPSRAVGREQS